MPQRDADMLSSLAAVRYIIHDGKGAIVSKATKGEVTECRALGGAKR